MSQSFRTTEDGARGGARGDVHVVEKEVLETRETETWLGLVTRKKDTIITGYRRRCWW